MPCYLFTWHAYGSWMPDRPQGYVKAGKILPTDHDLAAVYRARQREATVEFESNTQHMVIDELVLTAEYRRFRLHFVATDPSHLHVLVSWPDERTFTLLRRGIRESISRRLNLQNRRDWLSHRGSRKRVCDQSHFVYLVESYLPGHRGWKWEEKRGKFI